MAPMLAAGDRLPRLVIDADDGRLSLADLWQRRHLVLLCVRGLDAASAARWRAAARAARAGSAAHTCIAVSSDAVPGVPEPGIVVADRWGEIQHVQPLEAGADAKELSDWVDWIQHQCPECQGEAR